VAVDELIENVELTVACTTCALDVPLAAFTDLFGSVGAVALHALGVAGR